MNRFVLLSTARGKDANAKALITYLLRTVLTPIEETPSKAAGRTASRGTVHYRCSLPELQCGNGGGVDVYLAIHNQRRTTFFEQSTHLYSAALEVCPGLSISIIPVIGNSASTAALPGGGSLSRARNACFSSSRQQEEQQAQVSSPPFPSNEEGDDLELYDDVEEVWKRWSLLDSSVVGSVDDFQPHYHYVAVGGTFDHFHSGHKVLLSTAALYALRKLRVGVTDACLLTQKKFAQSLQPMDLRMRNVTQFLRKMRPDLELEVAPIHEMSGGTSTIPEVEALVVSPETVGALDVINKMRAANGGLAPMAGITIPQVQSPTGESISSTVLRELSSHDGST